MVVHRTCHVTDYAYYICISQVIKSKMTIIHEYGDLVRKRVRSVEIISAFCVNVSDLLILCYHSSIVRNVFVCLYRNKTDRTARNVPVIIPQCSISILVACTLHKHFFTVGFLWLFRRCIV